MANVRRLLGIANDANAGGTTFDVLAAADIPDASSFWPVTGGQLDKALTRIDRNTEVRGRRAASPPKPFQAAPAITLPGAAYPSILKKLVLKAFGGIDVKTGTAPAAITHTPLKLGFGSTYLPPLIVQMVRDDLNQKACGCAVESLTMTFPLDGEATFEAVLWPLYAHNYSTAPPSVTFTGLSADPFILRDAQCVIDGAGSPIPDLTSFTITYTNNLIRKMYAKRNREVVTLGTPSQTQTLWWPTENKLGAAQDVTYHLDFGNVSVAQELAIDFSQVQKFVFLASGDPLATTPVVAESMQITIFAGVHTGGGPGNLSARDEITSGYDGSSYYSDADGDDVQIAFVDASNTLYT